MVLIGVLAVAGLAWWLARGPADEDTASPAPSVPDPPLGTSQQSTSSTTATIDTERTVTVKGGIVTIEETSTVTDEHATQAVPSMYSPTGLVLLETSVITAQGRTQSFGAPVRVAASGSVTVRGQYRLTDCPDLLPIQWPSPTDFPDATRTYSHVEEPLHTAYAICPKEKSRAKTLEDLTGTLLDRAHAVVRLKWSGTSTLSIDAVGSASGVAAIVVEPGCGGSCVGELQEGREADVTLQPVDPCPPATDDNTLTVKLADGDVVAVEVNGLHRAICN